MIKTTKFTAFSIFLFATWTCSNAQLQAWIVQSTPICGVNNTLTLTVFPNETIPANVRVVITGLNGTDTPTSTDCFLLTGPDASLFSLNGSKGCGNHNLSEIKRSIFPCLTRLPPAGTWDQAAGTLTALPTAAMPAQTIMTFSFVLQNVATDRGSASVTLSIGNASMRPTVDNTSLLLVPLGRAPLTAVCPQITNVRANQTASFPSVSNNITVTVDTNVALPRSATPPNPR